MQQGSDIEQVDKRDLELDEVWLLALSAGSFVVVNLVSSRRYCYIKNDEIKKMCQFL